MSSSRRTVAWLLVGATCYLAGLLVFLATALAVYVGDPSGSLSNFSIAHGITLVLSILLLVLGRTITWRLGGLDALGAGLTDRVFDRGPEETHLGELGYRVPVESASDDDPYGSDDGSVYVQCDNCGKRNDPDYQYCANCSAELPG